MEREEPRRWTVAEVAWDIGDDSDEEEVHLYDDDEDLVTTDAFPAMPQRSAPHADLSR